MRKLASDTVNSSHLAAFAGIIARLLQPFNLAKPVDGTYCQDFTFLRFSDDADAFTFTVAAAEPDAASFFSPVMQDARALRFGAAILGGGHCWRSCDERNDDERAGGDENSWASD